MDYTEIVEERLEAERSQDIEELLLQQRLDTGMIDADLFESHLERLVMEDIADDQENISEMGRKLLGKAFTMIDFEELGDIFLDRFLESESLDED